MSLELMLGAGIVCDLSKIYDLPSTQEYDLPLTLILTLIVAIIVTLIVAFFR